MIEIHGALARAFKKKFNTTKTRFNIKARSVREVIQAMDCNYKGFRQLFKKHGYYRIVRGKNIVNGTPVCEDEIELKFGICDWFIMPAARFSGGKGGGPFMVILGIILIVVGVVFSQPYLVMAGISMIMGGISVMMMPGEPDDKEVEKKPSYLFNGPGNYVEPGLAIPVHYGEGYIGSRFISGSIETVDLL